MGRCLQALLAIAFGSACSCSGQGAERDAGEAGGEDGGDLDAGDQADAAAAAPNVVVDLGEHREVRSMAGLLVGFGMGAEISPIVERLGPRLLRGDHVRALIDPRIGDLEARWNVAGLERWAGTGVRHVVDLEQVWGVNEWNWQCVWCDGPNGPPWEDWAGWRGRVRSAVAELVDVVDAYNEAHPDAPVDLDRDFVFDVWNEPNNDVFWQADRVDESYEMYCVAENAIREVLPNAVVTGPSIASFSLPRLQGLFDFCRGVVSPSYDATSGCSRCRVEIVNWHENLPDPASWDPADPPYWFDDIAKHVAAVRSTFFDDPDYAALGLREITINEHTGPEDFHRPGEAVAILDALEQSGADAAARSCWYVGEASECFDRSINGLYQPPGEGDGGGTWRPRPVAHVYEAYPGGVSSRVTATATDPVLVALASATGSRGTVEILVGHRRLPGQSEGPAVEVVVRLDGVASVPALSGAAGVRIEVGHLPWTCPEGESALSCGRETLDVIPTHSVEAPIAGGAVTFSAGELERHGALILSVSGL